MRILVLAISAFTVTSCQPKIDDCETYVANFQGNYSGIALALETGDAYFSPFPDCSIAIDGSYSSHENIAMAWADASGHNILRPLNISASGRLIASSEESEGYYLKLEKEITISTDDYDQKEVDRQFENISGYSQDGFAKRHNE